ncbi:hypothetical protein ADUPG1_010262, partial [Aduncisulcus paluster]
ECLDECPLHYSNQLQCGGSEYGTCDSSTHTCDCSVSGFHGDSCQYVTFADSHILSALCSLVDGHDSTCDDLIDGDLTESDLAGITLSTDECLDLSSLDITDLSGLEYLTNITCIDLSGNTSLSDISVLDSLSEFNHLTDLNISDTAVDDLTQISSLSGLLTSLRIGNNPSISFSEVTSIFGSYLTKLDVSGMELDDLLWLYEVDSVSSSFTILFPMLEYLDASDNNISDPSPLFLLSSTLTTLDLRVNNICGMDDEEEVNAFVSVFTSPLSPLTSDGYSIFAGNVCLCTDDSTSSSILLSSNIVCSEIWPGKYSATCCSSCYTDVSSSSLSCVLIDDGNASLFSMCASSDVLDNHKKCIGIGSDASVNGISIVCSDGWYGDDCVSECPVDEYGYVCSNDGSNYNDCIAEVHTCYCSSPLMTGDLCELESGNTLVDIEMDVALVEAICESIYVDDADVQSLCSSSAAENILSSLTVDDLSTITSLTIPTTVASLSGLEYAEHLEILSFEPGNTLISDLSPIASLSSLYVLELDSLENMDVSLLSTLTDAVGALKMDLESDTSRWNGTSESYCVGLCSLSSLEISGSDSIGSDLSSIASLLNNLSMCSGQCVSSDDGTKVYPLSSTLTHLDLSSNAISDPTIVSLQPGFSGVTHLTLSDNSISDLALLLTIVSANNDSHAVFVDVSDNRLDCGSTSSQCMETLTAMCNCDLSGVEVIFGDVSDPSESSVSQDTTSPCGSGSVLCLIEDHRVCGVDYSVDNGDDTELACICGSGYYEDVSSGECVSAASSSPSSCSNCGGERGTCVYDVDSGDSLPYCECSDGWYGDDCSFVCPVSTFGMCSGSSRGTCDAATHTCVCESGYYGSACNLYCDSLSRCGLHGRCAVSDLFSDYSSETLYCECDAGWYGSTCFTQYPVETVEYVNDDDETNPTIVDYTLYCECDAGWYGSTCFTQYPVETVEYVNDDDETNPTIVDYVCGVNYSTDPSSSYSDYGIYSSDTDTYSCDCSSYGLITDASTSTCIDPATHPEYKDIAGNDTACLTCGTTTDSHGTCVFDTDYQTALCQCEYGWGSYSDNSLTSSPISCSLDRCGVEFNSSMVCSSHGSCYYNSGIFQYDCVCNDGWTGLYCEDEAKGHVGLVILCIIFIFCVAFAAFTFFMWFKTKKNIEKNSEKKNNVSHLSTINRQSVPPFSSLQPVDLRFDASSVILDESYASHVPCVENEKEVGVHGILSVDVAAIESPRVSIRDDAHLQSNDMDGQVSVPTVTKTRRVKRSKKHEHGSTVKKKHKSSKRIALAPIDGIDSVASKNIESLKGEKDETKKRITKKKRKKKKPESEKKRSHGTPRKK